MSKNNDINQVAQELLETNKRIENRLITICEILYRFDENVLDDLCNDMKQSTLRQSAPEVYDPRRFDELD